MVSLQVEELQVNEPLGSGGCGRVFLASDGDGREVALKIFDESAIRPELLRTACERLEAGGWPEGVLPVMGAEFGKVSAVLMTPAVLESREGGGRVPRSLQHQLDRHPGLESWKLVRSLARALGGMHRRGVVHGNVKPGNVFLDEGGGVLLADWALGNMPGLKEFQFTDALLYQPPEQLMDPAGYLEAGGMRWDVFAFGVLSFRLLTGFFPRCHEAFSQVAPPPGETRRDGLRADLPRIAGNLRKQSGHVWPEPPKGPLEAGYRRWIDRCLALEPVERPVSMVEVVEGFERVEAEVASARELEELGRIRKRAERRLKLAAFVAGALLAGGMVVAALWRVAEVRLVREKVEHAGEVARWQAEVREASTAKAGAEALAARAREDLVYERELGLARLEASRLIGDHLFAWAMEKGHRSLPPLDGRKLRLKRLERYFEDFLTRTAAIESLADERARVRLQLSEISLAAGDEPAATRRLAEALEALSTLPMDADLKLRVGTNALLLALLRQNQSAPETEVAFAEARKALAAVPRADVDAGRLDQLVSILDFHEARLLAARGDDTRAMEQLMRATQTLNRIADERPDAVVLRSELAACYLSSATILEGIGSLGDAREVRTLAKEQLVKLLAENPGDPGLRLDLAGCYGAMAEAAILSGDVSGAEPLSREALVLLDRILLEQPDHAEAASRKAAQLGLRAGIRRDQGLRAEALADYDEGIRILERVRASAPRDPLAAYRLALLWWQKGRMLGLSGRRAEEIALLGKARGLLADLESAGRVSGPRPEQLQRSAAYLLGDLGHVLQLSNRREEAVRTFGEAVVLWEALAGARPQSEEYGEGLAWCRQRLEDLK